VSLGTAAKWTLTNSAGWFGLNLVGLIRPPAEGLYRFFLRTLNGVGQGDLWIGNARIIASEGIQEGSYTFNKNSLHDFQVTYTKFSGINVQLQLEWESTKQKREIIPYNKLYVVNDILSSDLTIYIF
jgi:hypothetical protein